MRNSLLVGLLALSFNAAAMAETIKLHPGNGRITFTIPHLLSSVDGSFENFRGAFNYNPEKITSSSISWEVNVRSVNTGNSFRDKHLVEPEYFDADKYATMSFVSQTVKSVDASHLEVTGKFTLKGVTKTITVPVTMEDQKFQCDFSLLRSDYGFSGGRPAVGDQVQVHLQVIPSSSWFPAK
jgi:polyisoprenoid-binding protein YceI